MEAELKFNEKEKPKIYSINEYGELNKEFNLIGSVNKWILKSDENNPTLNYYIVRKIDKGNTTLIVWVIIGGVLLILFVIVLVILLCRRKGSQNYKEIEENFFQNRI